MFREARVDTWVNRPTIVSRRSDMRRDDLLTEPVRLEHWNASVDEVAHQLSSFVLEFESFTPESFSEIKFHLLKGPGLTREARREFCRVAIAHSHCPSCEDLYVAKRCPLWYRLYRTVRWHSLQRAPPCIRIAYVRRNIKTVVDYLALAGLLSPPFYRPPHGLSCRMMQSWDLCRPNTYCTAKRTDNVLEYTSARERVKLSRPLHSDLDIDEEED